MRIFAKFRRVSPNDGISALIVLIILRRNDLRGANLKRKERYIDMVKEVCGTPSVMRRLSFNMYRVINRYSLFTRGQSSMIYFRANQ